MELYIKPHIKELQRYQTSLGRDLDQGIRLDRNEKVADFSKDEITDIFSLKEKVSEPEEVHFHLWDNGCHFWKLGSDMHEIYDKMLQPIEGKELYLCGESYCKRQAWMEGALESCYDVVSKMKFKGITVKRKKPKKKKTEKEIS